MNRSTHLRLIRDINVVPYVDVMLVLLVIFMLTAPLLTQGIVIDLPDVAADPLNSIPDEPLVLSVDRQGRLYLNFGGESGAALDEQTVIERAAAAIGRNADTPLFVRGDEGATHGRVMQGFALLKRAGARQVVLMVDLPDVEP